MVDIPGTELSPEDVDVLRHPLVGSVLLFTRNYRNPQQLGALTAAIRAIRSPHLMIAVDHEGGVWLSIATAGLFRWFNGAWEQPGSRLGLPAGAAIRLSTDGHGRLWLAYPDNKLAVLEAGRLKLFTASDGLSVGNVLALDVGERHTWIAGDRGVALLSDGHFKRLLGRSGTRFATASGVWATQKQDARRVGASGISHNPAWSRDIVEPELIMVLAVRVYSPVGARRVRLEEVNCRPSRIPRVSPRVA